MMSFADPSMALLSSTGGDTVKLFNLSMESDRDPCTLTYSPSPGSHVNSVKWNHTSVESVDYSRVSRHLLVAAGDDGSIHLWDTTGRNPKIFIIGFLVKQHSAPTTGVCFSPSNDKIIATVGLDKKMMVGYHAGTNNGPVVFYDVRGKPQPITALSAYSNSE
ncbi:hypothetical protein IFM89_027491, partial [Coptis chinensis]